MFALLPLLWVEGVWAFDCASTNYDLNSQAEVDALGATGCDRVSGRLEIKHSTDITNLDDLANITSVGDYLRIYDNDALTNLDGLANLTSVGSNLYISNNDALTNLGGLANLTSVELNLGIFNNNALTDLDGLANLTSVGGFLDILSNDALTNLDGLAKLTSVGGNLYIRENHALTNLDAVANLTSVGGSMWIRINTVLTNLDGLVNLASVGGDLYIANNNALTNLDGLANLISVGGYSDIYRNTALMNLDGLANLTSVGTNLYIRQNTALTNLDGLAKLASVGGSLNILDNTALTDLDGLANITSVGALDITSNAALTNLDGLANLTSVGSNLYISNNDALTSCQGLVSVLGWPSGPPNDSVDGDIVIISNGAGCESLAETLASVSGPTQPAVTEATTSSNSFSLDFTPSTTTDTLFPIIGYSASCTGSEVDVSESPSRPTFDDSAILQTLIVTGYEPVSVLSSIEVDVDITHSDPSDLYITLTTPEYTHLELWNYGSTGGENLIGTFPTTLTSEGDLSSVARQSMDGEWILSVWDKSGPIVREGVLNSWGVRITEELARNDSGSPIEVFGATRGRDYTCTVAPVTKLGTTPVSDPYTVSVPLELPSVPTITSTNYEDGKIILAVSVSDNGGTDITGYEATCTDGTNTYTGTSTSSPITVSGLTNEVAYTCTVTATNSVGTSSASAATAPITPEATSTGLPIWLLYQATQ